MQLEMGHARSALLNLEPRRCEDVVDEGLELGQVDANLGERHPTELQIGLAGDVQCDADARERRAKLVGHVREELLLRQQQLLDPNGHVVERACHVSNLIGAAQAGAHAKIAFAKRPSRAAPRVTPDSEEYLEAEGG